jgi:ketosteroid isomerase-like protein
MPDETVEIVRKSYAAFNAGDLDAWRSVMHPDIAYVDHLPPPDASGVIQGRDDLERYAGRWMGEFEEFTAEVVETVPVDQGWVVSVVTWRGRGKGSDLATEWQGAELAHVVNGQIVRGETGYRSRDDALEAARTRAAAG